MFKLKGKNNQEYQLIGDPSVKHKPGFFDKIKLLVVLFVIILTVLAIFINKPYQPHFVTPKYKSLKEYEILDINNDLIFLQGKPRIDDYGIDLNVNILDGIYTIGFDNDVNKTVEDSNLYTPPCPSLHPVHHPDSILNPDCEKSSLQIVNFSYKNGRGLPYTLPLHSITNQIEKWKEWEKLDPPETIFYSNKTVKELVENKYHPFDYGYDGPSTEDIDDVHYYREVVNSRMDEVPDPRRRRLFSFILFNNEYDLLDLYLAEYYEVVDYFVIYEANSTFSGKPKPLHFTRALLETNRYDQFKDKLIPLPMEIIVNEDNGRGIGFPKEHLARRLVIEKGLRSVHARHGDLYMHGDLDEMAKVHVLSRLKKCGGWEHFQAGIGGGPKSFKDGKTKSYLYHKGVKAKTTRKGVYKVDYERNPSLGFLSWFHEYSFNLVESNKLGTVSHPNIAIFDGRRSLGQFSERPNQPKNKREEEMADPLSDPNFDPYQGYTYTNNTNDRKLGKGFLGEHLRFHTSKLDELHPYERVTFWHGGWHLSSFLPTIDHLYSKISTYSHFTSFGKKKTEEERKKNIIYRIRKHYYIFGPWKKYDEFNPKYPNSYEDGYEYNFDFNYWAENTLTNGTAKSFRKTVKEIRGEIPNQVWQNPICYSFMIDRDYGLTKKLWWQALPKEEWDSVRFENLNQTLIEELLPSTLPKSFRNQYLDSLKKNIN